MAWSAYCTENPTASSRGEIPEIRGMTTERGGCTLSLAEDIGTLEEFMAKITMLLAVTFCLVLVDAGHPDELGEEGFVDSAGVKIHYVTNGKGPLIILLHGFPD